jgi:phosphatidate cytidylyltransferase
MVVGTDPLLLRVFAGVIALLVTASGVGAALRRHVHTPALAATVANVNARIKAWWVMALVFMLSVAIGPAGSIALFALLSFLALREFVTLASTRRADHRTLAWAFFVVTPVQYALIWMRWYGLFSILIPVYAATFVAIRTAAAGDTARFLQRTAVTQWGLMICVYFLGHVPALLVLTLRQPAPPNAGLLFFLVFVVQISDVLQYVWGKTVGREPIAPSISPNKTREGFLGGILSATIAGTAIWWVTPFPPAMAALMALIVALMGFAGGLVMSAIKRDAGVKDYGALIPGHGGVLDRVDSLCFAAPVFFHLTRYFYC